MNALKELHGLSVPTDWADAATVQYGPVWADERREWIKPLCLP